MKKKRTYTSDTRVLGAAQTKDQILEAAKQLFLTVGFECVTIAQIAKLAHVSMPTIYAVFKSKRGVLQALIDNALPPKDLDVLVEGATKSESLKQRLVMTAKLSRRMYDAERDLMELLRGASVLAPEFKELEQEREKRRYDRQGESVKKMVEEQSLTKNLTLEKARDILWAMTGRDLYRMFVIERGWTSDAYEEWLSQTLEVFLM